MRSPSLVHAALPTDFERRSPPSPVFAVVSTARTNSDTPLLEPRPALSLPPGRRSPSRS
ncbi:hypothetical protein OAO87_01105 [bacterium]|nr:hypothetical protein [bacterium]